jgi:hypothetical protein
VDLTISDSIKTIGDYAFRGCIELKNIQIGSSVESIGNYAFYGCAEVTEIILPASLKSIGNFAFRGCSKVDAVILRDTIDVVGKHAFYGMTKATLYSESPRIPAYWSERCNSSYRPVVWGVELSADKTYVVSFTKGAANPENATDITAMALPVRQGYVCEGFRAPDGQVYAAAQINQVPEGTVLQVIWTEKT